MRNTKEKDSNVSIGTKILHGKLLYTLISILVGFLVGAILLQAAGINAGEAYGKLITGVFGKPKFIVWSIVYATPIILTGLSVAFSFQTGVFNIGAEGQYVVGTLAACAVGIFVKAPAVIHIPLCLIAAALAGGLWSMIVAILKVKRGINEVLSFIMFNWIAYYLSNYLVNTPALHKEGNGEATKDVLESAQMLITNESLKEVLGSGASYNIVIAVLGAILIAFILNCTTLACGGIWRYQLQ